MDVLDTDWLRLVDAEAVEAIRSEVEGGDELVDLEEEVALGNPKDLVSSED